jgi:hypothetical protein
MDQIKWNNFKDPAAAGQRAAGKKKGRLPLLAAACGGSNQSFDSAN